jgi:hypothetical protein
MELEQEKSLKKRKFSKVKYITNLFHENFFKDFKTEYPEYADKSDLYLKNLWKKIMTTALEIVRDEPDGIRLLQGMGDLHMSLINKPKGKYLNRHTGFEDMNWSTDRKPGKFVWKIDSARKINKMLTFLAFQPCKPARQFAFHGFRTKGKQYKDLSTKNDFIK